jgi:hypothetical protein
LIVVISLLIELIVELTELVKDDIDDWTDVIDDWTDDIDEVTDAEIVEISLSIDVDKSDKPDSNDVNLSITFIAFITDYRILPTKSSNL